MLRIGLLTVYTINHLREKGAEKKKWLPLDNERVKLMGGSWEHHSENIRTGKKSFSELE